MAAPEATAAAWSRLPAAATCLWFPTMDAGCQHCEERLLEVAVAHGLCPPPAQRMGLEQVGSSGHGGRNRHVEFLAVRE